MADCNWDPAKHGGKPCPVHGAGGSIETGQPGKVKINKGKYYHGDDEEISRDEYNELKGNGYTEDDMDANNEDDFGFDEEPEVEENKSTDDEVKKYKSVTDENIINPEDKENIEKIIDEIYNDPEVTFNKDKIRQWVDEYYNTGKYSWEKIKHYARNNVLYQQDIYEKVKELDSADSLKQMLNKKYWDKINIESTENEKGGVDFTITSKDGSFNPVWGLPDSFTDRLSRLGFTIAHLKDHLEIRDSNVDLKNFNKYFKNTEKSSDVPPDTQGDPDYIPIPKNHWENDESGQPNHIVVDEGPLKGTRFENERELKNAIQNGEEPNVYEDKLNLKGMLGPSTYSVIRNLIREKDLPEKSLLENLAKEMSESPYRERNNILRNFVRKYIYEKKEAEDFWED